MERLSDACTTKIGVFLKYQKTKGEGAGEGVNQYLYF
jgi:hypothetical protein